MYSMVQRLVPHRYSAHAQWVGGWMDNSLLLPNISFPLLSAAVYYFPGWGGGFLGQAKHGTSLFAGEMESKRWREQKHQKVTKVRDVGEGFWGQQEQGQKGHRVGTRRKRQWANMRSKGRQESTRSKGHRESMWRKTYRESSRRKGHWAVL